MTYVKRNAFFRLVLQASPAVGVVALTAALCVTPVVAADYSWPVTKIIDGDTVKVDASVDLPPELSKLKVRLRGVDAPGIGRYAKCRSEEAAGRAATAFTEARIRKAKRIVVRNPVWGHYGGRVIADLRLDGQSLSASLIAAGHGRAYRHGTRQNWCR